MAAAASATFGSGRYPARTVMNSYHHHSKQTAIQLGTANLTSVDHTSFSPESLEPYSINGVSRQRDLEVVLSLLLFSK
uniref:Uncharacterized protein n=1 Tax=Arabidopsis thaliana TaxID=3702 RepID=Q0WR21_ARATH|nr:hypothetical protein [Arabidopsis thaliana]